MLLTIQQPTCAHELCKVRVCVHACRPYTGRVYLCNYLENEKIRNQTLTETTGIDNQNLLKTQKLALLEKEKNPRKIS
jgi:hypothetical protein